MSVAPIAAGCELCTQTGGVLIHRAALWRVVRVEDAAFPAFYRVIWNTHRPEFSDLSEAERAECMDAVARTEGVLRAQLHPTKINLAALGNMVPHLHWHVIARFAGDTHFPSPIWASAVRPADPAALAALRDRLPELDALVAKSLQ